MTKLQKQILLYVVAYYVIGLLVWWINDKRSLVFKVGFPSPWLYGLTWGYWETRGLIGK